MHEQEEQHRSILQTALDGFWLADMQGRLLEVNDTYCRMSGYSAAELLTMSVPDLEAVETRDQTAARILKTMTQGHDRFESRHRRKDGSVFDVEVSIQFRPTSGGRMVAFLRDITERRWAEQALRESEEKYRALVETTNTGFLILDARGNVIDANQNYVRLTGHDTLAEILHRRVVDWTAPYDLERNARAVETCAAEGFVRNLEVDYIDRNGQTTAIEVNATVVGSGDSARLLSLCRDITERKRAEEELRQRSRQLAQLASELTVSEHRERRRLAQLLHDHLQQLLYGAQMMFSSLAADRAKWHGEAVESLRRTLDEALEASRSITRDLAPPLSLHKDLSAAMVWLAREEMRTRHQLAVSVQIGQVATGLTEAVAVLLFTAARELLFNVAKHAGTRRAGLSLTQESGVLVLVVSDQGKGAKPEALRAPSGRRGFGLFSIRERTELLGGSLSVDTGPGRGMCVTLSLPGQAPVPAPAYSAESTAPRSPRPKADRAPQSPLRTLGQALRVVFADDHRTVREALINLFRSQNGFTVVGEAENGEEAVACVKRLHPDVVIMDVSMPVMDGVEATRVIRKRWPAVKIIGLSMFDDDTVAKRMRKAGATDYVTKSAPLKRLIEAICACGPQAASKRRPPRRRSARRSSSAS